MILRYPFPSYGKCDYPPYSFSERGAIVLPLCILELSDSSDKQMMLELYECYGHFMYKVALGYTNSEQDTEDVVHNTWLSLCSAASLDALRKFSKENVLELQKYLARCVRNRSIDLLRKRGKRKFFEVPLENEETLLSISANGFMDTHITLQEEIDEYLYVLGSMPRKQKEYLAMRYLDGLSYQEIAAMLGKSEDSVRSQLSNATKNLRDKVQKMREDYAG